MKSKAKKASVSPWLAELVTAAIESQQGICAFLGPDDRYRDRLPLPSIEERPRWLTLWTDDKLAWDATIDRMLGRKVSDLENEEPDRAICWAFDRVRAFFDRPIEQLDSFFTSLEARFILRVFLPCLARTFQRPTALLCDISGGSNLGDLEMVVGIDPTVIYHPVLATVLEPSDSVMRRQRWELLSRALSRPPTAIEIQSVKYHLGALVRRIARKCGQRLTNESLWRMFNNEADSPSNEIVVPEIRIKDPGTFQKGVRRAANSVNRAL